MGIRPQFPVERKWALGLQVSFFFNYFHVEGLKLPSCYAVYIVFKLRNVVFFCFPLVSFLGDIFDIISWVNRS